MSVENYKVYAEDIFTKKRRFIANAVADRGGNGLLELYADECDDEEEIVIVSAEMSDAASALGRSRAGKPAAVAASRENGKKGGRPAEARYTLMTSSNTWENLTMRDLVKIVLKKWPGHEWPEDDCLFLIAINELDPQGIYVEETTA